MVKFSPFIGERSGFSSSSLGMLSSIVHQISDDGFYIVTVSNASDTSQAYFELEVSPDHPDLQATVDLASLFPEGGMRAQVIQKYEVSLGAYLLTYVGSGAEFYDFKIAKIENDGTQKEIYSNAELQDGDIYTVIPVLEGAYEAVNLNTNTVCEIEVKLPEGRTSALSSTFDIEVSPRDIKPRKLLVDLGGTIAFSIVGGRAVIEVAKK